MRGALLAAMLAAVVCLGAARGARAQVVISIEGSCPTHLTFRWDGATADEWAALLAAEETGQYVVPAFRCSGTYLGLGWRGLRLVTTFRTGSEGRGEVTRRASRSYCGLFLQMVVADAAPCTTSNVVQIPQ